MVQKLKKTCILVVGLIASYSLSYSEDSPQVVSQGGPFGATSIGDQTLGSAKSSASAGATAQNSQSSNANASSASTAASSNPSNVNERELLLKLQEQVQQLQGQVQQLKSQNGQLENQSSASSSFSTYSSKVDGNRNARSLGAAGPASDLSKTLVDGETTDDIMQNVNADSSIINLGNKPLGGVFNQDGGVDVGGAPQITTNGQVTFLGAYSGNNSIPIGQISSNLFASTLLGQREKFDDYSVFFGGYIQADAQVWFGDPIKRAPVSGSPTPDFTANGQNIYLTSSNLYFLSNLGHYVTAQFDFDADQNGDFGLGNAFVIFGNLDTSPFFVTAGRSKLSVGTYGGGGTYVGGITGFLAPGNVTNVSINYKDQVWNANVSVFGTDDKHANFSAGLFYVDSWTDKLIGAFNVGYVYNMAGANNSNLADGLTAIGREGDTVGALNVDANLTYSLFGGLLNLGSGWATTTNQESFNGVGTAATLAGAWYGAANYSAVLLGRNTNFGVAYGQTYNAARIPMATASANPAFGSTQFGIQNQLSFSAQRSYFDDNVLIGPEWAYQKLYDGTHMNTITLDMSVYV